MRPLPTASRVERAQQCPASVVLPQVARTSSYASRGTALHRFLEQAPRVGRDAALAAVPAEHRAVCEAIDLGSLARVIGGGTVYRECAVAVDVRTGRARRLGDGIERGYGDLGEWEVAGTADVVTADAASGAATVLDYKTGHERVTPARENPQMRTLAVATAALWPLESVRPVIVYIDERGALSVDEGRPWDGWDLDGFRAELMRMAERVRVAAAVVDTGGVPDVCPSESACRWCDAVTHCPAHTALARAMVTDLAGLEAAMGQLSPEQAGEAWTKVRTAKKLLRTVEDGLRRYAQHTPVPLPSGKRLAVADGNREIDPVIAFRVLGEMHGPGVATAAMQPSCSQASIERALAPVAEQSGARVSALAAQALDAIEAAGGVRRGECRVREVAA